MEDINLHFTGDFHAITTAHNLLSALIDNHIYWGNALGIDSRRVDWRRVLDMNDRALRSIVNSLGGVVERLPARGRLRHHRRLRSDGDPLPVERPEGSRERASATSSSRYTRDKKPVRARDLKADGAMTVLLKDALMPNMVQTLENNPAFIHGGPFANIAHGCNSVLATKTRAEARRLRRDRSRLRRRPRRREVLRHQVPQGGPRSRPPPSSSPPSARSRCTAASPRMI